MKFCTLASGSNGNSAVLSSGDNHILIDIGISNRSVCAGLESVGISHNDIAAVFITHEHYDHVRGIRVWAKNHASCVYFASPETARSLKETYPEIEDKITVIDEEIEFLNFKVKPLFTSHDTPDSVAYLFECDGFKIMTVTDLGFVSDAIFENMCGLDMLLIEANYDENMLRYGSYPAMLKARISSECGHLSNSESAESVLYAVTHGCRCVLLGHLSAENNTPKCAYETVHRKLLSSGIIPGVDMKLSVAPRGKVGEAVELIKEKL